MQPSGHFVALRQGDVVQPSDHLRRRRPAFAALVLAHEGHGAAMEESRLDHHTLACRCPRCGETRVFRREA